MNEDEEFIRTINAMMRSGFGITNRAVEEVGRIMAKREGARTNATWGIRYEYGGNIPSIVANAQFYHPKYMVATGLTLEEAEALIKLL